MGHRPPSGHLPHGVTSFLWAVVFALYIWLGGVAVGISQATSFAVAAVAACLIFLFVRIYGEDQPAATLTLAVRQRGDQEARGVTADQLFESGLAGSGRRRFGFESSIVLEGLGGNDSESGGAGSIAELIPKYRPAHSVRLDPLREGFSR